MNEDDLLVWFRSEHLEQVAMWFSCERWTARRTEPMECGLLHVSFIDSSMRMWVFIDSRKHAPRNCQGLYEWTNSSGSGSHKQFWLIGWGWYWKKNLRSLGKKFTFPGKNIYSPWKRNLGSSGPVVLWSCGPLVLWSSGPVVLWSSGPVVLVLWSCGPLVLWSCGSGPVVMWSPGKGMKRNMYGPKKLGRSAKGSEEKEEAGQLTNTVSITTRTKNAKIGF